MHSTSPPSESAQALSDLRCLLSDFEARLQSNDLRAQVLALVPAVHALRRIGKSLIPADLATSARDRILVYFQTYPQRVISGDELLVVSGIGDWPRRVRELRVQFGWKVVSGLTVKQMIDQDDVPSALGAEHLSQMKPDDYLLLDHSQDLEAAHRWNIANTIRRAKGSVRDKIIQYLRANVGKPVTGEELRYVANNRTEWARRVRELRTEHGWPVATRNTGRPDLAVGEYVLEADRQSPPHDRIIPDSVRGAVLRRDDFACAQCGWNQQQWHRSDPRFLELHHVEPHAARGPNEEDNLLTLCNVCHDNIHRT
jgi:hypothetical protein